MSQAGVSLHPDALWSDHEWEESATSPSADVPPAQDARFRIEVLLRIERARFKRRVILTLAVAFPAAALAVVDGPGSGLGDTNLSIFGGCCIFCHEDTKPRRKPYSSCVLRVFVSS